MHSDDLYHDLILEELHNPQNVGLIDAPTHTSHQTNASCGDELTVYLTIKEDEIVNVKWQGQGCAISQASMSLLSQEAVGKSLVWLKQLDQQQMLELLGLNQISPGRVKCVQLSMRSLQVAVAGDVQ